MRAVRPAQVGSTVDKWRALPVQRAAWLCLLLALVLAPLLSRMHQVVHLPKLAPAPLALAAGSAPMVEVAPAWAPPSPPDVLHPQVLALFAHHAAVDCQSIDQLGHAHLPLWLGAWVPPLWATASPQVAVTPQLASAALRHFDARGPPAPSPI